MNTLGIHSRIHTQMWLNSSSRFDNIVIMYTSQPLFVFFLSEVQINPSKQNKTPFCAVAD
jgi:proteasome lid subunit RPN8/RPN11